MDTSSTIQTPSAVHLPASGNTENLPSYATQNADTHTTTETFIYYNMSSLWSRCKDYPISRILLWSSCIALLVTSFILEQIFSFAWLQLALCLACFWIVPAGLYIRTLLRKFQDRERESSFIVTTASLSFIFIKAFAILDGYSMVALIRVPPCLTLAVWIASHWCNSDIPPPQIQFGA